MEEFLRRKQEMLKRAEKQSRQQAEFGFLKEKEKTPLAKTNQRVRQTPTNIG